MDYSIRFKDCEIYYVIHKNEAKPMLVLLHSFVSNRTIFDQLVITLKKDFQLLLLDLPGHGKSGSSSNVGFKDVPEILKTILDAHMIKEAHFIGVQEGALIAQGFAHIYQKRLKSLTAIGSYSIYDNDYKKIKKERFWTKMKLAILWAFNMEAYKKYYANKASLSDSGIERFMKTSKTFKRSSLLALKGFKRFYKLGKPNGTYPMYLVCGQHEEEVIKDACLLFEQKRPKTILEGFNKTKSIVFLDQNRLFQEHFLTFIRNQATDL